MSETKQDIARSYKKGICPFCGSKNIQRVSTSQIISVSGDRRCKDCGALWAPPVPKGVAIIMLLISTFFLVIVVALMMDKLATANIGPMFFADVVGVCIFGAIVYGSLCVLMGKIGKFTILRRPRKNIP